MVITFADFQVGQKTLRITLDGAEGGNDTSAITDLAGNLLDGDPSPAGGGLGYLAAAADLPSGDGDEGGNAVFYVTGLDNVPPQILSVILDGSPSMSVSAVDRRPDGLQNLVVKFSEPVFFKSSDVIIQTAATMGGAGLATITPLSVTGSSTDTVTMTFAPNTLIDTILRISLASDAQGQTGFADTWGNLLDGNPPADGSGKAYLAHADEDLPSGDGVAGGAAVFYVADETPPHITSVVVDNNPALSVSSTDPARDGMSTLTITFDETVVFTPEMVHVDVVMPWAALPRWDRSCPPFPAAAQIR